ncbi:MAG: outer membrane protein transport protein [Verrucomicrobiota bacterium]|nr:outer membrane protein transport protein [Verrucomicrobiota bacterium]
MKLSATAAGLFGDGLDARTIAVGGAEAAQTGSAIAAMNSNPAALSGSSQNQFEVNLGGTYVDADFDRTRGGNAHFNRWSAYIPAAAIAIAGPKNFPVHFGLAVLPDFMAEVDWRYRDVPGGLGGLTSYGEQTNRSRIISLRTNIGLSVAVSRWFSIGASGGAIYSEDRLHAPYIFQSQPVLAGFKTLLDLQADGFGPAFNFGAQFRPTDKLTIGLSYRPKTVLHSSGNASGNASAQLQALGRGFALVDPNFEYEAEVRTVMPQVASIAVEWQAWPRLRVIGGFDWIDWSDAFDRLVINLKHGSNPAINGVVGSDFMTDIAPLHWRDQFVPRAGLEFAVTDQIKLRGGYSYARSVVPSSTLSPLNAAIFEHKLSLGAGYQNGRYHTDLAWLWALPVTEHIGQSALLDGEYSNSSIRVTQHSFQWTAGIDF